MRRDRSSRATRRPFYRSTGQAISRHGKADEKTFGLPFPRDVSPKLARQGGANQKIAEDQKRKRPQSTIPTLRRFEVRLR